MAKYKRMGGRQRLIGKGASSRSRSYTTLRNRNTSVPYFKSAQSSLPLIPPNIQMASTLASELGVEENSMNVFQMLLMKARRGVVSPRVINIDERSTSCSTTNIDLKSKRSKDVPRKTDKKPWVPHDEQWSTTSNTSPDILIDKVFSKTNTSTLEDEVIDLTQEDGDSCHCVSDNDNVMVNIADNDEDDIVCLEDLTVTDNSEAVIMESSRSNNTLEELVKCEVPATEDSLSKGTIQSHKVVSRYWETLQMSPKSSSANQNEIRVCSYNVLCQQTSKKTMYLYEHLKNNTSVLEWSYRWPMIKRDLMHIDADIYGLQEVQHDHFDSHFKPFMIQRGYAAFYKRRTGGAQDGCALFIKRAKFEIITYRIVEYFVAEDTNMDRDQIGQILRIRCRTTRQELIFANTHLIFNTGRGDIKIGQLAILLANIHEVMTSSSPCPLIMTGDFNMEPLSYVYTYLSESSVYLRGLPRNELSGQGAEGGPYVITDNILPPAANVGRDSMFTGGVLRPSVPSDYFTHPLILTSVYHHKNSKGKVEISTYHKDAANPDFIFYSIQKKVKSDQGTKVYELPNLRLLRRMGLPDLEILQSTLGPWPNSFVPSDHIPLVADFLITENQNNFMINSTS